MFNTSNNEMVANRLNQILHRNISHQEMVDNTKFFGAIEPKGDKLESNEEMTPDFYNRVMNGSVPSMSPKGAMSPKEALDESPVKSEKTIEGSGSMERKVGSGSGVGVFKGQSEELFGKGKSGGKKSSWIEHIKNYQKIHGVSYKQAMRDSRSSYVSTASKGKKGKKEKVPKEKVPKLVKVKDIPTNTSNIEGKPFSGVVSQMRGDDLMGGKMSKKQNKPSSWIQHIKKFSKEHNISYKEALTKGKASYKK